MHARYLGYVGSISKAYWAALLVVKCCLCANCLSVNIELRASLLNRRKNNCDQVLEATTRSI
ncbi:hypothetical protein PF005_g335 [Phytophthora fragariae]|uniref:Uncharacterized protein n=1 Tax=Phytophthora fragariae TaxID=53985 RepID=A0A6A3FRH7_9STRA|nr:hypothetical protein PF003_g12510 [Phytophthora fragariae]KAE8948735.1 hypothetical protein PF009_g1693 [Phytophthora fragariae]KAE9029397.1 hypothetical protein PF011_g1081 [Phytophthora fragariae]KAE9137794.1 hypothetical protein PF007_g1673 [Phytophthora fragariae]KAE9140101.1 hypothetical protein PF010_g318 [Phytophthora fragariae]